jgi:hypothetical protein
MRKVVSWDGDDAITRNSLRVRCDVIISDDVIGLEEVISR